MALTKDLKDEIIKEFGKSENDTGSAQVQIALLSKRITQLTEHLKKFSNDQASRRGLLKLVGSRRRHLRYLSQHEPEKYQELIQKLGLRR
jgi:small subunit ribosomal protein S15